LRSQKYTKETIDAQTMVIPFTHMATGSIWKKKKLTDANAEILYKGIKTAAA